VLAIVCPFSECFVASKNHTVAACFSSRLPIYTTWRDAAKAYAPALSATR